MTKRFAYVKIPDTGSDNVIKNNMSLEEYQNYIKTQTTNKTNLSYLFACAPTLNISSFKKTAYFKALKDYEEFANTADFIPHNFYSVLEQELNNNPSAEVIAKYENHLKNISSFLKIEYTYLTTLIACLSIKNNRPLNSIDTIKAHEEFKKIIRKYNAEFKNHFINQRIEKYMNLLKKTASRIIKEKDLPNKATKIHPIDTDNFIEYVFSLERIRIDSKDLYISFFGLEPSENDLKNFIRSMCQIEQEENIKLIIEASKPNCFFKYESNQAIIRLKYNYTPIFNKIITKYNDNEKAAIVDYLNNQKDSIKTINSILYTSDSKILIEIHQLLKQSNSIVTLNNGQISFELAEELSPAEKEACKEYILKCKSFKKYIFIQRTIFAMYSNQANYMNKFHSDRNTPEKNFNDENYIINTEKWLDSHRIINLFTKINNSMFDNLTPTQMACLKKLLIDEELLICYYAGNISFDLLFKILKNFGNIYAQLGSEKITINNLDEIRMTANLFEYADDFTIGLIGFDIVKKVINYNQFAGTKITDELIRKRLKKVVDLAYRTEKINYSSLPFDCNVTLQSYTLQRYKNNDPNVFTSGVETKTCFFVSVNENDFFFYTLLNKNGEILKVTDKNGNFIARASCFRKNRVLMINGIRLKNNKVIPESKEETEEFSQIITLFKEMARKLIEVTADSNCPIDYVICNKSGILENESCTEHFDIVGSEFLRDPLNRFDPDWQSFISTYDGQENLLQEVHKNCNNGFTTDFGDHYPAILLYSRNNRPLAKFRDIGYEDPEAIYKRPRTAPQILVPTEINKNIINKVNRIRALSCFNSTPEQVMLNIKNYILLTDITNITSMVLGEDWFYIDYIDQKPELVFSYENSDNLNEISEFTRVKKLYDEEKIHTKKLHS